jgi:hypothetical protein
MPQRLRRRVGRGEPRRLDRGHQRPREVVCRGPVERRRRPPALRPRPARDRPRAPRRMPCESAPAPGAARPRRSRHGSAYDGSGSPGRCRRRPAGGARPPPATPRQGSPRRDRRRSRGAGPGPNAQPPRLHATARASERTAAPPAPAARPGASRAAHPPLAPSWRAPRISSIRNALPSERSYRSSSIGGSGGAPRIA